jgi:hypothetical protein
MSVTTLEELDEALIDILGDGFHVGQDSHGQLIIFSGLFENEDGELEEYLDDEDLEEDLEVDPDLTSIEDLELDEEGQ